ncbi:unnamed protein product, partial [Discosporangium mesarthrocarpum]
GVPLSSLLRLCKPVGVRRHTRWVRPTPTDKQRVDQVVFVLSIFIGGAGVGSWDDMFDWVHVDERSGWFYMMKDAKKSIPVPKPQRASNKWFILKMISLLLLLTLGSCGVWFEVKIGNWPIVAVVTTARQQSRARGDPVLRPVTVDGQKNKKIMIDEVIPAIKAKMPRLPSRTRRKGSWRPFRQRLGTALY